MMAKEDMFFSFWGAKGQFSGYVKFFSLFGFRCYQYIPQPFCLCTFQVNQKRILLGGCQNPEWELDATVINYFAESASAWSKRVLKSLDLSEISIGALDDERLLRVISELLDRELDAADRVTAELSSEDFLLSTLAVEVDKSQQKVKHAQEEHMLLRNTRRCAPEEQSASYLDKCFIKSLHISFHAHGVIDFDVRYIGYDTANYPGLRPHDFMFQPRVLCCRRSTDIYTVSDS